MTHTQTTEDQDLVKTKVVEIFLTPTDLDRTKGAIKVRQWQVQKGKTGLIKDKPGGVKG